MQVLARLEMSSIEIAQSIIDQAIQQGFTPVYTEHRGDILLTQYDAIRYIESTQADKILTWLDGQFMMIDGKDYDTMVAQEPLRKKGYRFITRITEDHVILASYPDGKNYMLFRETHREDDTLPTLRGRRFEFVKPVTEQHDPITYFLAVKEDDEDGRRKQRK